MTVRFLAAGDRALIVEFGNRIERELSERALRLDAILRSERPPGVTETVPTFRSVTIYYDPLITSRADLKRMIADLLGRAWSEPARARLWQIPVCYDGAFAPDLPEVAQLAGLAPAEIVRLHSSVRYHVYMIGFLPGFPYMGDLPPALALPRRADPRVRVPAGAVAIATSLSAIYPYESPGGWHLIGTTPIRLFDIARPAPALLAPGDQVIFEPVDTAAFGAIKEAVERGVFAVKSERLDDPLSSQPGATCD